MAFAACPRSFVLDSNGGIKKTSSAARAAAELCRPWWMTLPTELGFVAFLVALAGGAASFLSPVRAAASAGLPVVRLGAERR